MTRNPTTPDLLAAGHAMSQALYRLSHDYRLPEAERIEADRVRRVWDVLVSRMTGRVRVPAKVMEER